jgi:hypothetical protein
MVVEIKNYVVVFIGLALAITLALLPGAYILRAVIAVPVVGVLGFLVFLGVRTRWNKSKVITAVVVLLVLVAIGPSVLLIGGLLYLLVAFIAMFFFPTAINLGLSYLAVQVLPDRRIIVIPVFLIVSLALAFNVRIPGMLDDWFNTNQVHQNSVTRPIQLTQNEPLLLVSNVEKISFRNSPHEPIGLGGNEGCGCFYWTYPRTITEDIEDALQRNGIRYAKSGNSRHILVIDSHERDGITFLEINLWDGPQKTASYKSRLRSYYQHEEGFGKGHAKDVDYLPNRLLFLAQNSLWNHALSSVTHAKTSHPIRDFLEKSIRVTSPPGQKLVGTQPTKVMGEIEPLRTFQPYIGKQDYAETIGPVEAGCGNRIKTGLRYDTRTPGEIALTGDTVTFREGTESFTVLVKRNVERVICTNSVVYVIGALANQEMRIQKFSPRGELLADHVITLHIETFVGFPRKRIIEFSELGGRYEFTLLDIAEEGYYYAVKGAYRICAPLNNQAIKPGMVS